MATILELAAHAEVSAENVLRVVHGEPVNEEVERRVREAIAELGPPPYPRAPEVLPALPAAAFELGETLTEGVGSTVHEALRVEVQPVAQEVAELGRLFQRMLDRLETVGDDVERERSDRLEDVALLTELVTSGWRSVDRRLARLENVVARIEAGKKNGRQGARLYRVDDTAGTVPAE
ncbi:MAG: hypothetical protein ACRDNI_02695 [Gaiellaceae bacterium]